MNERTNERTNERMKCFIWNNRAD